LSGAIRPDVAQAIVGAANEGIVVIDAEGRVRAFNAAAERLFGRRARHVLGRDVAVLMPEPHRGRHAEYLARHLATGKARVVGTERCVDGVRADGTVFPLEISVTRIEVDGAPHFAAVLRDASERSESERFRDRRGRVAEATNRLLRDFVNAAPWNRKPLFEGALESLLGLTGSEFGLVGEVLHSPEGHPYLKAHAISDLAWDSETRRRVRREGRMGLEFRERTSLLGATFATGERVISNEPAADLRSGGLPPGHPRIHAYMGLPVAARGEFVGMVGVANRHGGYDEELAESLAPWLEALGDAIAGFRDLQVRRKAEQDLCRAQQRLRIVAGRDALTDVLDRASLMDAVEDAFTRSRELGIPFSAVAVDVDRLKDVNDRHGKAAGDHVLRHLARLLRETIRPVDILGRWGSEAFVLGFLECDESYAELVAERLRQRVEGEPFPLDEERSRCIPITVSAGVAVGSDSVQSARELVEWAERAVGEAKHAGRNCVRTYRRAA